MMQAVVDDGEHAERHGLRAGFDLDADAYDRTRPVLPAVVFDDLIHRARLSPGDRVLEIGCGTGQATVPLAERGLAVTAVELGPGLAARARARVRTFPGVEVLTSSFENWVPPAARFQAAVAVNSLHWIDPAARYAKPARLLVPGGAMVVASCRWTRPADADPFFFAVEEDYRAVGYAGDAPAEPDAVGPWHFPPEALEHFDEVTAGGVRSRSARASRTTSPTSRRSRARASWVRTVRVSSSLAVSTRLRALGGTELTRTLVALLTVGRLRN